MMRCFLPCFRSSSSKRRNHSVIAAEEGALEAEAAAILIQPTHQNTAVQVQESIDWIAQSKSGKQQEESCSKTTDEVTKSIQETERILKRASESESERDKHEEEEEEEECSESLFSLSLGSAGKPVSAAEPEVNSPMPQVTPASCTRKEVPEQLQNQVEGEPSEKEAEVENTNVVEEEQPNLKEEKGEARAVNHRVPNEYRYRECSEEEGYEENIHLDDEPPLHTESESEKKRGEEEKEYSYYSSSESLFSLSTEDYRKRKSSAEIEEEVSSAMPTQCNIPQISSVLLKPIENLSEGEEVVRKPIVGKPSLENDKENIKLVEASSSLKMKKEMRVDSSFSSWLVESEESTPPPNKSNYSREDRPILGALTAEEISKYSSTASSRRSRRSPTTPADYDDTPIIGTAGSYWSHSQRSKSRKNAKLNWTSTTTTVRTRLEPAFQATTL